jgi:hypothetical protein
MATRRGPGLNQYKRSKDWEKGRKSQGRRSSIFLSVESLEDRSLLSGTVTVSTTNDIVDGTTTSIAALIANPGPDGKISLREAIIAGNNTSATSASRNTVNLPTGTYTLTQGELDVTNHLTITGGGSAATIVQAGTTSSNGLSKDFSFNPFDDATGLPTVAAGFAVSLSGLTLQNGKNPRQFTSSGQSEGGAFDFDAGTTGAGSLSLSNVVVTNNQTTAGDGGGFALFDGGTITITNCTISNNIANGTSSGGGGDGGGIYIGDNFGAPTTVAVSGSTITNNRTAGSAAGSGGGFLSFPGIEGAGNASNSVVFHNSTISNNTAATGQDGGGLDVFGALTVDQGTVISGNVAGRWGGGLFLSSTATISNTTITGNSAGGGLGATSINEGGGGIFANNSSSNVTVNNSRIVGNIATVGSQLDGNGAASSGGVLNAANNWYGTNTPSSSFFGNGVKTLTTSPFLVMTFGASPTSLSVGGTSTLTAAITKNSINATGFTVPDGTPGSFSGGTIGSVNPSSGTTTSGTETSTFTASATPGKGNVSATIDNQTLTVQLTVIGVPTANAQSVNVAFNTAKAITLTGSDPDSPPLSLTYTVAANPTHGTLSGTAPNLTYTPNAGYNGSDSFTFTVNNGTNTSSAATVTLSVAPGTPTANLQSVNVTVNTAKAITLTGSDPDIPPLSLTYAVFTNPAHGTLSGTAPNLTYTPNAGYNGSDSFTFTVNNGTNTSSAATVTLSVNQAVVSGTVGVNWGTAGNATLQTAADGLRLLASGRTTTSPWIGIDKITVTLSAAASITASDVSVTGTTVANYGPVTISGSGTTSITVTLAQPINAVDRVTVTIGNAAITTFTRRLDVLPGDVNDDGVVNPTDLVLMRSQFGPAAAGNIFSNFDGNTVVDVADYNGARPIIGTALPGPLLAAPGGVPSAVPRPRPVALTQSQLTPILAAAIRRWELAGMSPDQDALLHSVKVQIVNIPGGYLGLTPLSSTSISVDDDGAGNGWYVDPTPMDDLEFPIVVSASRLATRPTLAPAGRMDLLTVVMHELGHVLGRDSTFTTGDRNDLMYAYLTDGERRLPPATKHDTPIDLVGAADVILGNKSSQRR